MGRKQTKETRTRISNSMRGRLTGHAKNTKGKLLVPLVQRICKNPNCSIVFECHRWRPNKYCSIKCACYNNGGLRPNAGKKGEWYFNKHQNKEVYLDSTWEVEFAKWLDKNEIVWERPTHFPWVDAHNKPHKYYPDFYLVESKKYYDIKNDYLIERDQVKINAVLAQNNIDLEILSRQKLDSMMH